MSGDLRDYLSRVEQADRLKLVEGDGRGLLMLDQELAQRIFTPPTPAA